jgi:chromate reductase
MSDPVHMLGFAGSLRKGSFNKGVLAAAVEILPDGMTLEPYDLASIPLYNGDLEAGGPPGSVIHFNGRVAAADALPIVTPEYNHSVPGVLLGLATVH